MDISIELLTVLMFGAFFLLLAIGFPLAWVTLSLAFIFSMLLQGTLFLNVFPLRQWDLARQMSFVSIPLFLLMANFLRYSGIAEDLFDALYKWMGPLKGGLAMATVVVCAILAAMIGTAGADVTIMGLVAFPAMMQRKYNKPLALGCVMAGGILGVMIPPSVMFIIYGVKAAQSIGKLFIGGIGPGLLLVALYITYIAIRSYIQPTFAPAIPKEENTLTYWQKLKLLKTLVLPGLLILAVLGSIYLGVATPSEAAAIGVAGAMICAGLRKQLTWHNTKEAMFSSLKTTGLIMWIVFGANAFIGVYTFAGGSNFVKDAIEALPLGYWGTLILIQAILLVLGCVIDVVGIVILTVPIFLPIVDLMGYDPLWFGILFNVNLQIAYLSPPFGYGMFYMKAVSPQDITTHDLYQAVWPFIILQVIGLALVMVFPQIATWLPSQMIR